MLYISLNKEDDEDWREESKEKKAHQLGAFGLKDSVVVSSLGFLFASYHPDWEPKKPGTQQHQQVHSKEPQQKPAVWHQRTQKGAAQ